MYPQNPFNIQIRTENAGTHVYGVVVVQFVALSEQLSERKPLVICSAAAVCLEQGRLCPYCIQCTDPRAVPVATFLCASRFSSYK
jgi:hypothetical protein